MSRQLPTLPKGTRDFSPVQMAKRNFILNTIKGVFEKYGYQPIETPSMENLSVLMGKYGDEGDQLLFKILNSGDFLKKVENEDLEKGSHSTLPKVSEKGLRYDLTVPFARYVAMHQHEITYPFKRYQIQPVWRADRPQKGRYREFVQCDADVVGSNSTLNEAEIVLMISEIFHQLKIEGISIRINHRAILSSLSKLAGNPELESAFCVAIDKRDKIGDEKVKEELIKNGFQSEGLGKVFPLLDISGDNTTKLNQLENVFTANGLSVEGIENIYSILAKVKQLGNPSNVVVDYSLARGLSYYTGAIIEVTLDDLSLGSLSGGGRYDNLTGVFGVPDVPGVGFSLGVDRIYDVMNNRNLFDQIALKTTQLLLVTFDQESFDYAIPIVSTLRQNGLSCELYPEPTKMKKQLNYANKKGISYVAIIGTEEVSSKTLSLKSMETGEQQKLTINELLDFLI